MVNDLITVPSYILGEERMSPKHLRRIISGISGKPMLEVHDVDKWGLVSAIKTASKTQHQLENIPLEKIIGVLSRSVDYYFDDDSKYNVIVSLTGSPITFVREGTKFVKDWCKDLNPYLSLALEGNNVYFRNSAPVVAILPSNSEQEVPYVLAQTLLSRNATIIRPSSLGASSYSVFEFVSALNKGIDKTNDPSLEPLRSAISVINTQSRDYLDSLSIDGWNYIFFGDNFTVKEIEANIREKCSPRKIISYGTGLSMSVILDDSNLDETIRNIMESVIVNVGNECTSTDVVYVKNEMYDVVLRRLQQEAEKYRSGNPFDPRTIGLVEQNNVDYITGELLKRGKLEFLKSSDVELSDLSKNSTDLFDVQPYEKRRLIHTSVVPLSKYETAMEYPGPIVSVRPFTDMEELREIIEKDLRDNGMEKNLVTSVFTEDEKSFYSVLPLLRSHTVKLNKPTHDFNILLPHQGVYIVRELSNPVFIDKA